MPFRTPVPPAEPDSIGGDTDGLDTDIAHAFRPKKKRKIYRSRDPNIKSATTAAADPAGTATTGPTVCDAGSTEPLDADADSAGATLNEGDGHNKDGNPLALVRQQRRNLLHRKQGTVYDSHSTMRAATSLASVAAGLVLPATEDKVLEHEAKERGTEQVHTSYLERFAAQRGHTGEGSRHM